MIAEMIVEASNGAVLCLSLICIGAGLLAYRAAISLGFLEVQDYRVLDARREATGALGATFLVLGAAGLIVLLLFPDIVQRVVENAGR